MARACALLVSSPSGRAFVRAEHARQIVPQPTISRVPNSAFGMALVGGRVVSVLSLGESTGALLLSELDGEPLAFAGLQIERVTELELEAGGALVDDTLVPELPLRDLLARALGARPRGGER